MLHLVNKHEKQNKKKNSIRKESNTFANQIVQTRKEIDKN